MYLEVIIFGLVWFGSVFIKKSNQTEFKKTKTVSNRSVSVRFFGQKPVHTSLARFFSVWLVFFQVFFNLGSVRFFQFQAYKTKTKLNRLIF